MAAVGKDWGAIKYGHVFKCALTSEEPVLARVVGVTKRRVEVRET